MPEDKQIFRKVVLDRLSSPEQLDQLMQVTSSKGWLALTSLAAVLCLALLWGAFGSIHTKVSGRGILIKGGHVFDVVSLGSGVVTKILVNAGDQVKTNDLIALVSQPELELQITNTVSNLSQLSQQHTFLLERESSSLLIETNSMDAEFTNLVQSILDYEGLIGKLQEKKSNQAQAVNDNLIVPAALLATEIDIFSAQQDQARARQRLLQIQASQISRPTEIQQIQIARQQHTDETSHALELLRQQLRLTSEVRSPHAGTVLEVVVDTGSYTRAGDRILTLEADQKLEAVIFTPPDQGKRIKPNFQVQLSPATVKREESGFIRATVSRVSPFPSTPERMMRVLRNQDLIKQLSGSGAPIEVLVTLETNLNGSYKWSSSKTPPEVSSGTLCDASFIVDTNRPIALVLPLLKKSTGM